MSDKLSPGEDLAKWKLRIDLGASHSKMVVINPQGEVIYDGAIDDKPTTDLEDVPGATNYVSLALEQAMAGKQVATTTTRPYGCSVKYADSGH